MKTLCLIFTLLFWIFIYKLSFLEKDTLTSRRNLTIFRDSEGIPHIFAKNYDDIFYGLGYAQGQDRLYTLYFKKMLVEGRVSEIFGKDALLLDL
jgi:penicillin amidase